MVDYYIKDWGLEKYIQGGHSFDTIQGMDGARKILK